MAILYAVLNPLDGTYIRTNTVEERDALIAQFAVDLFMSHTHGEPSCVVEVSVEGNEVWRTPAGDERLSDAELKNRASLLFAQLLAASTAR